MTARVTFIRHGPTAWNAAGRIQGRADIPLSDSGRRDLAARVLADGLGDLPWVSSPLLRARETAAILSGRPIDEVATDDRLTEMSWGEWEGQTLEALRARGGDEMTANEARGLDFRPSGGESPAEVWTRVMDWLSDVAGAGQDVVAVTHKGVIRVVMARAFGWDMRGKAPVKLDWSKVHVFEADATGEPSVVAINGIGDV